MLISRGCGGESWANGSIAADTAVLAQRTEFVHNRVVCEGSLSPGHKRKSSVSDNGEAEVVVPLLCEAISALVAPNPQRHDGQAEEQGDRGHGGEQSLAKYSEMQMNQELQILASQTDGSSVRLSAAFGQRLGEARRFVAAVEAQPWRACLVRRRKRRSEYAGAMAKRMAASQMGNKTAHSRFFTESPKQRHDVRRRGV